MEYIRDKYEVVVIGGGHAGCEAALAAARIGCKTLMLVMNLDSIAMMPCNPSIGGTSKGHLVREVDALGGEMGRNIDKTFLQIRMLNKSKGPAVHSLRAQADKAKYAGEMRKTVENTANLTVIQGEAVGVVAENGAVVSVKTASGAVYETTRAVLCTGTYLRARCLFGDTVTESGPNGFKNSSLLCESLRKLGIRTMRFKTGTPARLDGRSVNFEETTAQYGDDEIVPFSFETDARNVRQEQVPCYITYTNERTHGIIRANLDRSPMYSGLIEGTGTRYCPSIEDKVVRFADKESHQLFIEPEGEDTNEVYVGGMSSSLPEDVQLAMYRSVKGLENCHMVRTAYAIEYDCIDATQLKLSLEFKDIAGLFSAGQFNGSSGYEEAAAQGLMAGINAAMSVKGKPPVVLTRADAYIGVLIDDLVTKGTKEPYRMMTSRAEYRLLLRQDNADLRLREVGYSCGLVSEELYSKFLVKKEMVESEIKRVKSVDVAPSERVNELLDKLNTPRIQTGVKLADLIKRPAVSYSDTAPIDLGRNAMPADVSEQVSISIKYEGYIKRQSEQAAKIDGLEKKKLPPHIDYMAIHGISNEARQKLSALRPENLGQASRITGVSPADVFVLTVLLKNKFGVD